MSAIANLLNHNKTGLVTALGAVLVAVGHCLQSGSVDGSAIALAVLGVVGSFSVKPQLK